MDNRGRIYENPTEEQIKKQKMLDISEDYEKVKKMNKIERKQHYKKKMNIPKSGQWGKNYFSKKDLT